MTITLLVPLAAELPAHASRARLRDPARRRRRHPGRHRQASAGVAVNNVALGLLRVQ